MSCKLAPTLARQMWRHNYVIGRNEYLIFTSSESTFPWIYSLQLLFKSTHHSWKCEWVFFSEHSVYTYIVGYVSSIWHVCVIWFRFIHEFVKKNYLSNKTLYFKHSYKMSMVSESVRQLTVVLSPVYNCTLSASIRKKWAQVIHNEVTPLAQPTAVQVRLSFKQRPLDERVLEASSYMPLTAKL